MTSENLPTLEELRSLQEFFTEARARLLAGQTVDMTGIDQRVSNICQVAQKASPEEQQVYLPELTVLVDLLNGYESDLRTLQAELKASSEKRGAADGA